MAEEEMLPQWHGNGGIAVGSGYDAAGRRDLAVCAGSVWWTGEELALGSEQEEAAASLGASRITTLRRVIVPELLPALLTGFSLAFARGLGEYGSVIFIAGNLPFKTEIAPLLITIRLEEYDYDGAVAIAALLLAASFLCLLAINAIPLLFSHRRLSHGSSADG